jgi:hypothetical protein
MLRSASVDATMFGGEQTQRIVAKHALGPPLSMQFEWILHVDARRVNIARYLTADLFESQALLRLLCHQSPHWPKAEPSPLTLRLLSVCP